MRAEIISIGDELLIGQVVNTNASYISKALNEIGISVERVTTIGDEMRTIQRSFRAAWKDQDVVFVTGGLGPTHDDISKAAVAKFFGKELTLHRPTLTEVKARFARLGYAKMPAANIGQAMVPVGFKALKNERGTAPGLLYQEGGKTFVILPGVPQEMQWLMENAVLPMLRKSYRKNLQVIVHRTISTIGIGESSLAEKVGDPSSFLSEGMTLAFLPRSGGVRLRVSAKGSDRKRVESEVARIEHLLRERVGKYIFGEESETLEQRIVALLREQSKTVSTAESCTGGMIAARLTDVPGSSAAFVGSVVSYQDSVKIAELGVPHSILDAHGAVSEETVRAMAASALKKFKTTFALAVSGVAGPDGGTEEKPVGTVWIALAEKGRETTAKKFSYGQDRPTNRERTVQSALDMLRRRLLKLDD